MIQELLVGGVGVGLVGGGATLMEKCSMLAAGEEMRKASAEAAAVAGSDPNQAPALKCPRCDSTNTKFCYYNNYNLTQPRHFCKSCRRYWTKGGALRNVPIGGGCRKNKSSGNRSAKSKTEPTAVTPATTTNSGITPTTSINITNISNTTNPSCSSSNLTETTSSPLNPTSISSFLMPNSHFFDSQNFLGFLRNGSVNSNVNHSSNVMFQRSISDSQSRDSLSMNISAGDLWRGGISNTSHQQNQQLPFYGHNHQNQFGLVGDHAASAPASGGAIQDLYLRLRAMTSSYGGDEQQSLINPVIGGNSSMADIVPPAVMGDTSFWGSSLGWSDLHNTTASASFP